LEENSLAVQAARKVMRVRGEHIEEGAQLTAMHMSLAVTHILGYRILDIVQWLKRKDTTYDPPTEIMQKSAGEIRFLERLVRDNGILLNMLFRRLGNRNYQR
jgi:hypothetical protein